MATRSRIAIEYPNGSVQSIYCHNDGYLDHNGRILNNFYTDREKVRALIKLGDISSLSKEIFPTGPHSFSNPQGDVVVAYHRDRGELGTDAADHARVDEFFHGDIEEYGYLLTKEDKWVFATYNDRNPQTLIE